MKSQRDEKLLNKIFFNNSYLDFYNLLKKEPHYFYKNFQISKRNGGFRSIDAPTPLLKEYLDCILKFLYKFSEKKIQQSNQSFAYKKNMGIKEHATQHLNKVFLLKLDIKNFFMNISQEDIYKVFLKLGFTNYSAEIMSVFCTLNGSLPQGSCTSPILSNLFFTPIDNRLHGLAKKLDITYTRYADDLFFSANYIKPNFQNSIIKILEEYEFKVNEEKTSFRKKGQRKIITGVDITNNYLRIPKQMRRNFRQDCYQLLVDSDFESDINIKKRLSILYGTFQYILYVEGIINPNIFRNFFLVYEKIEKKLKN